MFFAGCFKRDPISTAIVSGNLSMVKFLYNQGAGVERDILFATRIFEIIRYLLLRADLNITDDKDQGDSLLHKLCRRKNLKVAKYLTRHHDASVSIQNAKGQTALHLACRNEDNLKLVQFLIEEQNADPSDFCNKGKTALHYAAEGIDLNILKYLVQDQKLSIHTTDFSGRTALHLACKACPSFCSRFPIQEYLIEEHPHIVDAEDWDGKSALTYCLENFVNEIHSEEFKPIGLILVAQTRVLKTRDNNDSDHIFNWIKQSYKSDIKKGQEGTKVEISSLIAGLQSFRKRLDKKDETNIQYNPLLYVVCYCNRSDIAEYMFNQDLGYIEKYFNADDANLKRNLLLKSYLKFSCENGLLDLTRFLFQELSNRHDSYHPLLFDGSFLSIACYFKHVDVFQYLLEDEKAKEEAAEFLKDFPLHFACRYDSLEMLKYLIATKPADIGSRNAHGNTPFYRALLYGSTKIVQYLIEENNSRINTVFNYKRNVFQVACISGSLEVVKYISEKTRVLDVNAQDEDGLTALHLACESQNIKVVKFLVSGVKSNLHSVDNEGRTPLHVACELNDLSIAKFLVSKGSDVLAKDMSGKIALQIAAGHIPTSKQLIALLKAATKR